MHDAQSFHHSNVIHPLPHNSQPLYTACGFDRHSIRMYVLHKSKFYYGCPLSSSHQSNKAQLTGTAHAALKQVLCLSHPGITAYGIR